MKTKNYKNGVVEIQIKPMLRFNEDLKDFEFITEKKKVYFLIFKSEFLNLKREFEDLNICLKEFEKLKEIEPLYFGIQKEYYNLKKEIYKVKNDDITIKQLLKDFISLNKEELEKKPYYYDDLNLFLENILKKRLKK